MSSCSSCAASPSQQYIQQLYKQSMEAQTNLAKAAPEGALQKSPLEETAVLNKTGNRGRTLNATA
jgi:hypothetical protein